MSPYSVDHVKQVGRGLMLLGRHDRALKQFKKADALAQSSDWEVYYYMGRIHAYQGEIELSIQSYSMANAIAPREVTYLALGQLLKDQGRVPDAIDTYADGIDTFPNSAELLTSVGLLHLQQGSSALAFESLGTSMTVNPRDSDTILAAGSMIQENEDYDVALIKYRVAAVATPTNPQLWNNIGMCFYGKGKYLAAASCLKKAQYYAPMEWIIAFNLGLVHLAAEQYASAFTFFSAAINLNPQNAPSFMYLAVTLSRLEDLDNMVGAYDRAAKLDPSDLRVPLNFAISLHRLGAAEQAAKLMERFHTRWEAAPEDYKQANPALKTKFSHLCHIAKYSPPIPKPKQQASEQPPTYQAAVSTTPTTSPSA